MPLNNGTADAGCVWGGGVEHTAQIDGPSANIFPKEPVRLENLN